MLHGNVVVIDSLYIECYYILAMDMEI